MTVRSSKIFYDPKKTTNGVCFPVTKVVDGSVSPKPHSKLFRFNLMSGGRERPRRVRRIVIGVEDSGSSHKMNSFIQTKEFFFPLCCVVKEWTTLLFRSQTSNPFYHTINVECLKIQRKCHNECLTFLKEQRMNYVSLVPVLFKAG